jgi:GxxExxY protein
MEPVSGRIVPIPVSVETVGKDVVDAAFKVHKALGPGLLECVYEECMFHELTHNRSLRVDRQVDVPIRYDDKLLDGNLRLDLLIEGCVILKLKSVENIIPLYQAQLISYLKLTGLRLGYLINFNVALIKNGIKRIVV